MKKTLFAIALLLGFAPVARMDYDTSELCQARVLRYAHSYAGYFSDDNEAFMAKLAKMKCDVQVEPGMSPLPIDLTEIAKAALQVRNIYTGEIIANYAKVSLESDNANAYKVSFDDSKSFIQGLIDYERKERDTITKMMASNSAQYATDTVFYVTQDYANFATWASGVIQRLSVSTNPCKNNQLRDQNGVCYCPRNMSLNVVTQTCEANSVSCGYTLEYDRATGSCKCSQGLIWDQKSNMCTHPKQADTDIQKKIPANSRKYGNSQGWVCNVGYVQNKRGYCIKRGLGTVKPSAK